MDHTTDIAAEVIYDDAADRTLLQRVAEHRDVAAMEQLYLTYRPRMVRFLSRLTRDEGLIEEAYNDVMIKVWEKADQYRGQSKASSWIFSIAYRTCLRMVKKQQRRDLKISLVGDALPETPAETTEVEPDADLANAVRALSGKHRLVVELCYFEGYPLEEIAAIIDCPLNTVKTRLHHARKKLKASLGQV